MIIDKIKKEIDNKNLPQSKEIQVRVGIVYTRITGKVRSTVSKAINKKLSFFVPHARFVKSYQNGKWDGYIRFYKLGWKTFPTGFLADVEKILKKKKVTYEIIDNKEKLKVSKESINLAFKSNKKIIPRQYEKKAVITALDKQVGVINIPTGTGKTLIINLIMKAVDIETKNSVKHLVISSGLTLLSQLHKEISSFQGEDAGFIGGSKWEPKRITIASIDTLFSVMKNESKNGVRKNELMELLNNSKTLFLDEAHHSPAKTFKEVVYKSKAPIRIGTTATYKRSSGDNMTLTSVTGNVIYKKSISRMIDKGWLAKPTIILVQFEDKEKSDEMINAIYNEIRKKNGKKPLAKKNDDAKWSRLYSVEVAHNNKRNKLLAEILGVFNSYNLNTVLFVREKFQGEYIYDTVLKNKCIDENNMKFMSGSDSTEDVRNPTLKKFMKGKLRNIICTRILNEGVDFPVANAGIRAEGQLFEGNVIQQLGRILRKVKLKISKDINREKMQRIFWVDICDLHHPILAKHSLKRIKTYESEKAFDIEYITDVKSLKKVVDKYINETHIV